MQTGVIEKEAGFPSTFNNLSTQTPEARTPNRLLGVILCLMAALFALGSSGQEIIYVPVSSSGPEWVFVKEMVVVEDAEKHVLSSIKIRDRIWGSTISELKLYDVIGIVECGNEEKLYPEDNAMFIPLREISTMTRKDNSEFEFSFKDERPSVCGRTELWIEGKEDLGDFGDGDFHRNSHSITEFSSIVLYPDRKTPQITNISAVITTVNNDKKKLRNLRHNEFTFSIDGSEVSISPSKVARIDCLDYDSFRISITLTTGAQKEVRWKGPLVGVTGIEDQWYELIRWDNIKSIEFR